MIRRLPGLIEGQIQIQTRGLLIQDARVMMGVGRTGMSQTQFRHADEPGETKACQLPWFY
jgi:hypothetical protein